MAIIKGRTPAKILDASPFSNSIENAAAGIAARDARANEIRDQINLTKSALLKETRDNDDDFGLAQTLEKGFKGDVSSLVDKADMDYSSVDKNQLQSLAADYMGRTEWRVLTEAKRNQDEAKKAEQEIEKSKGTALYFGNPKYNPLSGSLYEDDGSYRKFTGNWGIEPALDHSQAAKKLFDAIGNTLNSDERYKGDPNFTQLGKKQLSDGTYVPDWIAYWEKHSDKTSNNWKNVDAIIKGGIEGFMRDPEGDQYYRIHKEDGMYKQGMSEEDADKYARQKVKDLVFTYGESEKIDARARTIDRQSIARASDQPFKPSGNSGGSGSGAPVTQPVPTAADVTDHVSFRGLPSDTKNVFDTYEGNTSSNVSLTNVVSLTNGTEGEIGSITNPHILATSATLVYNPDPGDGNTPSSNNGFIYKLYEGDDQKKNPTAVNFKANTGKGLENTSTKNYNELFKAEGNVLSRTVLDDEGNPKKEEYTVDRLVDEVGDDLLHADDMRAALDGWIGADNEVRKGVESDDTTIKWIQNNSKDNTNVSLSSYNIDPNTGDVSISPVLNKLKEYYEDKLESNVNPKEAVLYEAKLKKVTQKINMAESFKEDKADDFFKIKQQTEIINEHNKMLRSNILISGRQNGLSDELINGLLGEGDLKSEEYKSYIDKSKKNALHSIGIKNAGMDRETFPENPNYSKEDNIKYRNMLKNEYAKFTTNLYSGNYNIDEIIKNDPKLIKDGVETLSPNDLFIREIDKNKELTAFVKTTRVVSNRGSGAPMDLYTDIALPLRPYSGQEDVFNTFFHKNEKGFLTPVNGVQELHDKTYNESLKKEFNVNNANANVAKFIEDVETMNDVFTRKGVSLFMPSAANTEGTGWANATYIKQQLKMWRGQANDTHKGWRNVRFDTEGKEEFDKDTFYKEMAQKYESLKESGQISGGKSQEEWMDQQFNEVYFKGIRMDIDNPDNPFVAHYTLPNNKTVEHNIVMARDQVVEYFGVPAVYYQLGVELANGLKDNDKMYADFEGMGKNQKIRLHQSLLEGTVGSGDQTLKKGQFYLLYDKNKGVSDPNIGSVDYHPAADNVERKVFKSYNEYFRWFQGENASEIAMLSTFKKQRDLLINIKNPKYVFPPDHPFIKNNLTYDEILNKISEWSAKVANGETVNFQPASQ